MSCLTDIESPTSWKKLTTWWADCSHDICMLNHSVVSDILDHSPPFSSCLGVFQARILEWVAISYSITKADTVLRIGLKEMGTNQLWNWILTVLKIIKMTLVRPPMIYFKMPVQAGCMRQVLRAGALGWPRGMGWGGRWEGDSGWGTHVNPWLIHVNIWQKPLLLLSHISHVQHSVTP